MGCPFPLMVISKRTVDLSDGSFQWGFQSAYPFRHIQKPTMKLKMLWYRRTVSYNFMTKKAQGTAVAPDLVQKWNLNEFSTVFRGQMTAVKLYRLVNSSRRSVYRCVGIHLITRNQHIFSISTKNVDGQ